MIKQNPYWKPKFLSASFVQIIGSLALFTGHLDQGSWVTVTTLALGAFTAGSVVENNLLKPKKGE